MRLFIFVCLILSIFAQQAKAETQDLFSVYLQAPKTRLAVAEVMKNQARLFPGFCNQMRFDPVDLTIIIPPQFSQIGILEQGSWKDSWQASGCHADRIFNVVTTVSGGSVSRIPMLPGTSHANLRLERDALAFAYAAADGKNCADNMVADTAFIGTEPNASTASLPPAWKENWAVVGCGHKSLVTLHFRPDMSGTVITTDVHETRTQ